MTAIAILPLMPLCLSAMGVAGESAAVTLASYKAGYATGQEAAQCILLVTAPDKKQIRQCELTDLLIGDDEDNAIDGRQDFFRPADRSSDGTRGLLPITLQDPPDSTTLRIEGTVELFLADGEETRLSTPPCLRGRENNQLRQRRTHLFKQNGCYSGQDPPDGGKGRDFPYSQHHLSAGG